MHRSALGPRDRVAHGRARRHAAGRRGLIEVPLPSGRILDALTERGCRATEVERSGRRGRIARSIERLIEAGMPQRVLRVPHQHMALAVEVMSEMGVTGTVKNLGGTSVWRVR